MPDLYLYGMLPDISVLFYLFYKFYKNTYNKKKKNVELKFEEKVKWIFNSLCFCTKKFHKQFTRMRNEQIYGQI